MPGPNQIGQGMAGLLEPYSQRPFANIALARISDSAAQARAALLVDFRAIYSLPFSYLTRHAQQLGDRWRCARRFWSTFPGFFKVFMRVGLPSAVPEF